MADEHPLKPFYSVLVLAFACSTLVAAAAVGLRPYQEANRTLDQKKNILSAAGIFQPEQPVADQFEAVETRLVDLRDGSFVSREEQDPESFDQLGSSPNDEQGRELEADKDLAGIGRLEPFAPIYLIREGDRVSQVVLPVRGKGLWSTMYAYVSLDADLTTIRGISFYEHGETPGLGGEIENPRWQAGWEGKKVYDPNGDVAFEIVKDGSQLDREQQSFAVDAISGATLTSQGVEDLMHFWFGEHGYQPFFNNIRQQGGFNG